MSQESQSYSRREFVRTSALLAGGLALSQLPLQAGQPGAEPIRIGLIGCGGRGTGAAAQALSTQQNVKLVAMADAFKDRLDSSYQNLTGPDASDWSGAAGDISNRIDVPESRRFFGFDAYEKVLPLVDVVILATPPGFRPMHFEAAIKAGKHVFMEKPVATDGPGVRRVLAAAEEAKKKQLNVVVGLQRHYQTVYQEWIKRLHEGAIGKVQTARVYWNDGGVWVNERKPGMTEMEYQMRNWYYFNWLCGDHIVEQHIHNLDVGNWVMQDYPVRCQGMGGRQVRTGKEFGEIFDHHAVEYEYADGRRMYSQCRHIKGCNSRVTEAFQGTNGSAPKPGQLLDATGKVIWEHKGKKDPNPYQVEHDVLFEAIAKGEYKFADAENAAKATLTAIMGRMATYSGNVVEWDQALNSDVNLFPDKLAWDALPKSLPDANGFYPIAVPGVSKVF
ncbi:MAG: Gfo/Idh/MocA family oxidoreductase [Bacteroidia bacterium]|nr:Gfo/Idh/MocA family oxidoreductase [Bacteroidia bacterium]